MLYSYSRDTCNEPMQYAVVAQQCSVKNCALLSASGLSKRSEMVLYYYMVAIYNNNTATATNDDM